MTQERDVELRLGWKGHEKKVRLEIPSDEPKPWDLNDDFKVMGKAHPRDDAVMKVTGAAKYAYDINLPGLLYAGFARSPHARARVGTIDTSAAEKHPGVKAVISLGRSQVRYAGEPLVALAAESRQALAEGIAKVKVEYEVLPNVARIEDAMAEDAPSVHRNRPNYRPARRGPRANRVEKALADAPKVIEATCTTQVQTHNSLETHGCTVQWQGKDLTIWASTQSTFGFRDQIANMLRREKIDFDSVTVKAEFIGGGFGAKFGVGYHGKYAVLLAKKTGRPVKLMLDRREEHTDTGNRPDSRQEMKLAIDDKGKLGAYQVISVGTPGVGRRAGVRNPMIYDFDPELVDKREGEVSTNAGPQAAFRAPGHPQGSFGLETMIDLAAEAAGIDPVRYRMMNDHHPVRHFQYEDGAKRIGWDQRQANGSAKGRFRTGYGVASAVWYNLGRPRAEVLCRIGRDGSVQIRSGCQDIGTGTRTIIAIVAAEELGLPLDRVKPFIGNTNDPIGPGSGGSTTAPSVSPAARQAAFLAGRELREIAAKEFGCKADDLVMKDAELRHVSDASKRMSFTDACQFIDGEISALGKRRRNYRGGATYASTVGGVQFAKVTVDCDFGIVKLDRIVALQDAGRIINRTTAESQVTGGVIQGISYALYENRVMDRQLGHMVNADMEAYKIAGPVDIPDIETVLYDVANGANNTGVAGIAEPTMIPTASAIAGAVHNAIGVRVKSLPLTPDRILDALAEKEGR